MKIFMKIFLIIMMLACMCSIYAFSSQSGEKSNNISMGLSEKITGKSTSVTDVPNKEGSVQVGATDYFNMILRKYAHFTLFFVFGLLSSLYASLVFKKKLTAVAFTFILCTIWASLDEIHQLYVPGRTGQITDVLIDISGALLSAAIVLIIRCIYGVVKAHSKTQKIKITK